MILSELKDTHLHAETSESQHVVTESPQVSVPTSTVVDGPKEAHTDYSQELKEALLINEYKNDNESVSN